MNPIDSLIESINFTFQYTSGKAKKLSHDDEFDIFLLEIDSQEKICFQLISQNHKKYPKVAEKIRTILGFRSTQLL